MNRPALSALAADAYHQVLDNWVFRILTLLALLPILFCFVLGLHEDEVVLLFGLRTWSYESLFSAFGVPFLPSDPQGTMIQVMLALVLEFLAGSLGMLLSIAATAFFVPRLLEKGAAELYFHKPVSRWTLYLSRYCAGLLFIALASSALVVGMYLGLLLVSGYNDPGILVGALHLTYVFALIHSFSMLVGVLTRSTVASILLAGLFFFSNGCIHMGWIQMTQHREGPQVELEHAADPAAESTPAAPEAADAAAGAEPALEHDDDSEPGILRALRLTLDVLHYTLPKTTDADFFARKLRKAIDAPAFREEDSLLVLQRLPADHTRLGPDAAAEAGAPLRAGADRRTHLGEVRLACAALQPAATLTLWRRPAGHSETRFGERVRTRVETSTQAAQALAEALTLAGAQELERTSTSFGSGRRDLSGSSLTWLHAGGAGRALVFKGADPEWVYTLLVASPEPLAPEQRAELGAALLERLSLDSNEDWYPRQLAFDAPLRFNILFSLASSLAFSALLLLLGAWRLGRIAF